MSIIAIVSPIRFEAQIMEEYNKLSLQGHIVLLPCLSHPQGHGEDGVTKLMDLHKAKMDMADRVLILNFNGYMGRGTYEEIGYATIKGKRIEYLVDPFWNTRYCTTCGHEDDTTYSTKDRKSLCMQCTCPEHPHWISK